MAAKDRIRSTIAWAWAPFSFRGRIGRKQYWIRTLLYLLGGILGGVLLIALAALNYNPPDTVTVRTVAGFVLLAIATVVYLVTILTGLVSTGIRRLHDRGKSGWWLFLYYYAPSQLLKTSTSLWHGGALIILLAVVAILIWGLIDLGVLRGERGDNVYGPSPSSEKS
jgi:uncharacterized membrane protein YhaH (DUF805 family)